MFNVTGGEIIIILLLALIVLGPDKLPDFIRRAGRVYGEVRKMANGFQSEFRAAVDEPLREMRETANIARTWFEEGRSESDIEDETDDELLPADDDLVDDGDDLVDDLGEDLDDEGDDEGDDPNFYDEHGNLLEPSMLIDGDDDSGEDGDGVGTATA